MTINNTFQINTDGSATLNGNLSGKNNNVFEINADGSAVFNGSLNNSEVYVSDKFSAALVLINNQISKIHDEQNKHDVHSDGYKSSLEDESTMLKIKLATTELFTNQKKSE